MPVAFGRERLDGVGYFGAIAGLKDLTIKTAGGGCPFAIRRGGRSRWRGERSGGCAFVDGNIFVIRVVQFGKRGIERDQRIATHLTVYRHDLSKGLERAHRCGGLVAVKSARAGAGARTRDVQPGLPMVGQQVQGILKRADSNQRPDLAGADYPRASGYLLKKRIQAEQIRTQLPSCWRRGRRWGLLPTARAADRVQHVNERGPPRPEIEVLRIVVIAHLQVQDAMKRGNHPTAAPNARDQILKGKPVVLDLGESRVRRFNIRFPWPKPGLDQFVMKKITAIYRAAELELGRTPGRGIVAISFRLAGAGEINMGFAGCEVFQIVAGPLGGVDEIWVKGLARLKLRTRVVDDEILSEPGAGIVCIGAGNRSVERTTDAAFRDVVSLKVSPQLRDGQVKGLRIGKKIRQDSWQRGRRIVNVTAAPNEA